MKLARIFLALTLLTLVGCATSSTMSGGSESDRAALTERREAWEMAANAAAWDDLAALYADDGVLMAPNAPAVRGRSNIRRFLDELAALSPRDVRLAANEVEICGDTAYEVGTYTMSVQPPGAQRMNDSGKYIVIYKRQGDGSWMVARDIFNTDVPMSH